MFKELRELFKIPKANIPTGSLHQQIFNTAKNIPMETTVLMIWILQHTSKSQTGFTAQMENIEHCNSQKTIEGMVNINTMKSFNFLKLLDTSRLRLFHCASMSRLNVLS